MIDVDPDFCAAHGVGCLAEAILRRSIECDGDVEIFRLVRRRRQDSSPAGMKLYFSSIPSSFQTFTVFPNSCSESASAIWLPSASPSGRTWLRTAKV